MAVIKVTLEDGSIVEGEIVSHEETEPGKWQTLYLPEEAMFLRVRQIVRNVVKVSDGRYVIVHSTLVDLVVG